MKNLPLEEIIENLNVVLDRYSELPLDDVRELSEILRELGVNLSYLVILRDEYNRKYQSLKYQSTATNEAAKTREADFKLPELDNIRKILRHFSALQQDIRTQISLRKNID